MKTSRRTNDEVETGTIVAKASKVRNVPANTKLKPFTNYFLIVAIKN